MQLETGVQHSPGEKRRFPNHDETYILDALNPLGCRLGYRFVNDNDEAHHVLCRWPEQKFPLKVCVSQDYGFLFTPLELKLLSQSVQKILLQIQNVDPERFKFVFVPERYQADIIIKWRRSESAGLNHCYPEINKENHIRFAEMIINIPLNVNENNLAQSRITMNVMHNMLHALGVLGHSENPMDTAHKEWSPRQQLLTERDIQTLRLLYQYPTGTSKKEMLADSQEDCHSDANIMAETTLLEAVLRPAGHKEHVRMAYSISKRISLDALRLTVESEKASSRTKGQV